MLLVLLMNGFVQVGREINKVIIHRSNKQTGKSFASLTESDRNTYCLSDPMSGSVRDLYLRRFVGELAHLKPSN
jgi:hypothetical protein